MSRLILVRHGDTELNSAERYWGHTDVSLSAAGFSQAESLCHRLVTEKIDAIYSSDLRRALATAEIIASSHQVGVITRSELREVNFGQLEGLTFNEISRFYPEVVRLWVEQSLELKYPGGEGINDLSKRVGGFIANHLVQYAPEQTIVIVAHSGVLRVLLCRLLGIGLKHWRQLRLDLASLSIVETYPQGVVLSLLNDVSHLAQV